MRSIAKAGVSTALLAGLLAFVGVGTASAQQPAPIQAEVATQEDPSCETVDMGMLDSTLSSQLTASGRWTTEDCDSRFRGNSDAHTYRFEIAETGRIRIDLISSERDSYLYLLDQDGNRIAEDDDGIGTGTDARIERRLAPGTYMVEATALGGRSRGPADFTVAVSHIANCGPMPLGTLAPDSTLTASGSWTLQLCDSRLLAGHPSQPYSFRLAQGGRVRIDLTSATGDAILVVAPATAFESLTEGLIAHDDDGGDGLDSRIEQYLPPDDYIIEATTYRERDYYYPPQADFTLTISLVDEADDQLGLNLKIEEIHTPAEVVVGDPVTVDYRVSNQGSGELPDDGSYSELFVVSRGVFDLVSPITGIWQSYASYHTGEAAASATSAATDQVAPFSVTFPQHGPTAVFVGVGVHDADDREVGIHGIRSNLMVLSGPVFDPVEVRVDGAAYTVSASADDDGLVETPVVSVADPTAEVDPKIQAKARYAAGVRTQLMDGIFERPAIAGLPESADPVSVTVAGPSSSGLLLTAAPQYWALVQASRLLESLAAGEAISPVAVENLVLALADEASGTYAYLAESWRALLDRVDSGEALSFEEASTVQAQVAYVEHITAPIVSAGEIVASARAAELGWDDPEVQSMLSTQPSCHTGDDPLSDPLALAGVEDADALVELDAEMRAALFAYIVAIDNVLCAVENVDAANFRFLERLGLDSSERLLALVEPESLPDPEPEEEEAPTLQLRVTARLGEDGRIEHGVELFSGFQILPEHRYLPADSQVGTWHSTQDVELDGTSVGQIRARRLADGRVELGFRNVDGDDVSPDVAYLSADLDEGVWYRTSLIDVPMPPEPTEDDEEAE